MQCYPYLFDTEKGRFMAYNGNNYGYNGCFRGIKYHDRFYKKTFNYNYYIFVFY